jgi:hypothetical protein
MTKELDEERVREFVRLLHTEYEDQTILSDVTDVTTYQDKHEDLDYRQIGKRTYLPVDVLNHDIQEPIVKDFIRAVTLGERNYILNQLSGKADQGKIDSQQIDELNYENFVEWCNNVQSPDHLFLPLDSEYHNNVFEWRKTGNYYFQEQETALYGPYRVRVHWVPLKTGIENGYLISSEGLTLVQKWFGDSSEPNGFEDEKRRKKYDELSKNRSLMVYIGNEIIFDEDEDTEGYEEKVDFLYRVVLSTLLVQSDYALQVEPQKELSTDAN